MTETVLQVQGLNCSGCVGGLTKKLAAVPGVVAVSVDLVSGGTSTARVTTEGDVALEALEAAVVAAGKRIAVPDAVPVAG